MSDANLEHAILGAVLDAEGAVLRSNAGAILDQAGLRPEDFTDERVRVSWGILQRLAQRRRPTDAMAVYSVGKSTRTLSEPDLAWLRGLQVGNGLDRERFADLVEGVRATLRTKTLLEATQAASRALSQPGADLAKTANDLEATIRQVLTLHSDDGTGEQDIFELASDWDRQESGNAPPVLVPTGIGALDDVIGGFVPNLNMIVGLPSVGKSALLGTVIDAQLSAGLKVGLFGLEDGTRWLAKRIVAREMAMPVRAVGQAKRTAEQGVKWVDVAQATATKLRSLTTYRHDTIDVDELCRRAASWVTNRGVQIIYVDHGGEVDHSNAKFEDHRLRVAESYRRLRNLALRFNVPVVVLAHTGRPSDDNEERPPRVTEIAESAYIERRARLILGLWRKFGERDVMRCTVLKQTEGESNVTCKLQRYTTAALINTADGEVIDLHQERLAAQKEANDKRAAAKAEKEAAKVAAKKVAKEKPQLSLVEESDGE